MSALTIALIVIAGVVLFFFVVPGVIAYYTLARPAMRPLPEADRDLCREIVRRRKGYPFVCRRAVKTGQCPCQPCPKLQEGRERHEGLAEGGKRVSTTGDRLLPSFRASPRLQGRNGSTYRILIV